MDKSVDKMLEDYTKESLKETKSVTLERYAMFHDYPRYVIHSRENAVVKLLLLSLFNFDHVSYKSVLDIGCGDGFTLRELLRLGIRPSNCYGIDASEDRIKDAKEYSAPSMQFVVGDAKKLPYKDKTFDIVTLFTLLSSVISKEERKQIISEAKRVLAPNGIIIVYEQNETINSEREKGVSKKELTELSNVEWIFQNIIPRNLLPYDEMYKLAKKTKDFKCYVALAKKGVK